MLIIPLYLHAEQFIRLNEDQGLSSRRCFSVKQDKEGFIWIANKLAIDRYDGHEFVGYDLTDKDGRKMVKIGRNFLSMSPEGTLWAFNSLGYLYRYDERSDMFRLVYSTDEYYRQEVLINSLYFENDSLVFIATLRGVLRLDLRSGDIQNCAILNYFNVNHICKKNDLFYVSTSDGLYIIKALDGAKPAIVNSILKGEFVNFSYYDERYGEFWIATFSNGIYILPENSHIPSQRVISSIKRPVRAMIPYGEQQYALGIDGDGILLVGRESKAVTGAFVHDEKAPHSIGFNSVYDLIADKENLLWVATYHAGISYTDHSQLKFKKISHSPNDRNSLPNNHLNALLEDSDGDLWFATNDGLSLYERSSRTWTHFFKGSTLHTIEEYAANKIWVGGYTFGIAEIDKRSGHVNRYRKQTHSRMIDTDHIYAIHTDRESGEIWMGGIYGKISCFNPGKGTFRKYKEYSTRAMMSYNDSLIIIASEGSGLFLLNKNSGEPVTTRLHCPVNAMLKENEHTFWVSSRENGLYYYDLKNDSLRNYTQADGLSSDHVYSVEKDDSGNLWIGTENGLNKLNPITGEIDHFTQKDGLVAKQFLPTASFRCSNGDLMFGTVDGGVFFTPGDIRKQEKQQNYPLKFTGLSILGNLILPDTKGAPIGNTINETQQIVLPYDNNYFSLTFTMPNYSSAHATEYSYYLDGYDLHWNTPSVNNNIAAYSKLEPGSYDFYVRTYLGKKPAEERRISITIKPPWWNTKAAWLSYSLIALLLIYISVRTWHEQQKKKQTEEKMDFFINTAHDILTPLNLIEAPLKDLSNQHSISTEADYLLSLAIENCRKLNHFIHQLIDFQKIMLSSERLIVTPHNLQTFFTYKKNTYQAIASQKFITLNFHIPHTDVSIYFDKEKVEKILATLLSNAIKYTPIGGTIDVRVSLTDDHWGFSVRDSGSGISRKQKEIIFKHIFRAENMINLENAGSGVGLKMAHALIRIHQGKIRFSSKEGSGNEFSVTLPRKFNEKSIIQLPDSPLFNIDTDDSDNRKKEQHYHLFIISPNTEMLDYLKKSFSREYDVSLFAGGSEALLQLPHTKPDLIFASEILSDMTGLDFCHKIKENKETENIPLIMIIDFDDNKSIRNILSAGAIDFVQKPFEFDLLALKTANYLSFQLASQKKALNRIRKDNVAKINEQKDQEFMEKIIRFIEKNLDNPELNNSMLCKQFALSRTLLYYRITQLTNTSPTEFIQTVRLKNAANMLLSGQHSVAEVSYLVGIENPKYFSRLFKRYYNVSPKDYGK
ncbi:MAG: helix-turn-helix domain-containing protein [Tannerellaceae bacterium]|jgi:signal transduction histidine kinase/ligand-binding sensor domain-containing protein/AraC-like DNA-binding protein|nr:helix-turn-helix domain-containing protein [Tannerellaceae bacterium]